MLILHTHHSRTVLSTENMLCIVVAKLRTFLSVQGTYVQDVELEKVYRRKKKKTSEAHNLSEKFRACYQPQLRHDSLVI